MFDLNELPEDVAAWASVIVDFPRLAEDSANSCPLSEQDIFEYVRDESADQEGAEMKRFRFIRTGSIRAERFWIWEYLELDDEITYVWVQLRDRGGTLLSLNSTLGLNPEQFLLAAYHDRINWS